MSSLACFDNSSSRSSLVFSVVVWNHVDSFQCITAPITRETIKADTYTGPNTSIICVGVPTIEMSVMVSSAVLHFFREVRGAARRGVS